MAAIMIGIETFQPVKINISQDTQKLKKISQKEHYSHLVKGTGLFCVRLNSILGVLAL